MSDKHNLEPSIVVGPIDVGLGGVPFNERYIEYWRKRALRAEALLESSNSNHREMAKRMEEIERATIERCAKVATGSAKDCADGNGDWYLGFRYAAANTAQLAADNIRALLPARSGEEK